LLWVAGGWWLVAGGWWLVAGGWWLVAGKPNLTRYFWFKKNKKSSLVIC
jgi:hypothetical protein